MPDNTEVFIHKIQLNFVDLHSCILEKGCQTKINLLGYFSFDGSWAHLLQTVNNWRENTVKLSVIAWILITLCRKNEIRCNKWKPNTKRSINSPPLLWLWILSANAFFFYYKSLVSLIFEAKKELTIGNVLYSILCEALSFGYHKAL